MLKWLLKKRFLRSKFKDDGTHFLWGGSYLVILTPEHKTVADINAYSPFKRMSFDDGYEYLFELGLNPLLDINKEGRLEHYLQQGYYEVDNEFFSNLNRLGI